MNHNDLVRLAEEAGLIQYASDSKIVEVERFAQLILQECVRTLEFHGYDEAVPYIEWMAKNRLGVE